MSTPGTDGPGYTSRLVKIDRPLLRIPNLAIHLDGTMTNNLKFSKETELRPFLGLVADKLNGTEANPIPFSGTGSKNEEGYEKVKTSNIAGMGDKHHPLMLAVLADELGCSVGDIQELEL